MSKREGIQLIAKRAPVRHEAIHQRDESRVVRELDEVRHLVHHKILQAFARLPSQLGIQPDAPLLGVAAAPFGLHSLYVETINGNVHSPFPFGNQ